MSPRTVAVLVYDDVEVLDFAGPFEVFSVAGRRDGPPLFEVFTVAETPGPVVARHGLTVGARHGFSDAPAADVLVVPGGLGTRTRIHDAPTLAWVRGAATDAEVVLSVCTGAFLLAAAGLLDGLRATTHHGAFDLLRSLAPRTEIDVDARFVDNGAIVTAAGISSGLDASLHVVARLHGRERAEETARHMEYAWNPDPRPPARAAPSAELPR